MKYLSVAFLLLISISGFTQQIHIVYIQTDNKQPFYVKMDKKILSSTSSGYLIIPKLQDSAYRLSIGFPKNEWQEQKVTCNINQADAGYLLKNFGEKGWGLFNLQTMNLVMADTVTNNDMSVVKETRKDAFADVKFREEVKLGAINSINWGRILAQITYYFYSWLRVTDTLVAAGKPTVKINYAVPTGNFGDILAGYYAKRMGLPVDRLVVCANQNDVLHR